MDPIRRRAATAHCDGLAARSARLTLARARLPLPSSPLPPSLHPSPAADGFVREALPGVKKAGSAAAKKVQLSQGQQQMMQISK